RVSLRDISEAAFRGLTVHGASHGEARAASRRVLQAELVGGGGLAALLNDLASQPWKRAPVEVLGAPVGTTGETGHLVLRSPEGNRLLREAPLAVELVASGGDARVVAVPTAVAGSALLDALTLEIARASGVGVGVVICPSSQLRSEVGWGGSGDAPAQQPGQLRWARPDGSMGVGNLDRLPATWQQLIDGPGVFALRDIEQFDDVELSWISAQDRTRTRTQAAAGGVIVDADLWRSVYAAARRYLVPER
ncbi:MAG: hypothetical protein Q4P32_11530, partial [Micrococcales bacterium]|nr:hypothetical protein [Micrococcales bacterium]